MASQYLTSTLSNEVSSCKDMVELLQMNAWKYKDKDLYIFLEDGVNEHARISHAEIFEKASSIASILQRNGMKGDRVLLLFPSGLDFAIALYACFLSGMIAVPAYPPHRRKENTRFYSIINDADPSIILSDQKIINDIQFIDEDGSLTKTRSLLIFENLSFDNSDEWTDPELDENDIAFLQYTSGSTGRPHGVMVSHANIINNSECIKLSFGFDENLRGINWLPNFHDMGLIGCLIQPVYVGGMNIIIPPMKFLQNPLDWFKGISKYKATNAGGPNFAFDYSVEKMDDKDIDGLDLSSLTTLYCGAEPIREETFRDFTDKFSKANFEHKQFYPCYGLAESVLIVTGGDYKEEPIYFDVDSRALEENKVVPASDNAEKRTLTACGYAWHGTSVAIVNPDSKALSPEGEIGEIWTKGPSVTKGYWNDPEGTDATFNAFISGTNDGPWMRTGDLGFIHDGQLYVSGRLKDLIILRGSNFFPNDIEHAVENSHEAIRKNASAVFSADVDKEERLVITAEVERAFVRGLPEEEVFEAIRSAVFSEFGAQPYAISLIRTGSILKTSSGKIQRFAMKKAWQNDDLTIVAKWKMKQDTGNMKKAIGFRPEFLREWMINWMAQKLELDPGKIDPDKPVSAYGLDSITAVSLERDVNNQFGVEWPIESFLKENSVNQLVEEGVELLKKSQ